MSPYGILLSGFWDGDTGRRIADLGGSNAQLVALYLTANPDATMIGLYGVEPIVMQARIRTLGSRAIAAALDVLAAVKFAEFDAGTSYVWVREMAKFRLGLHLKPLDAKDNRIKGVNRLYQAARPNPFLGAFYDRYRKDLFLVKRRKSEGQCQSLTDLLNKESRRVSQGDIQAPSQGASEGAYEGAQKPVTETVTGTETVRENREQEDQDPRAARFARVPIGDVLPQLKAATHHYLDEHPEYPEGTESGTVIDLVEHLKTTAARLRCDYNGREIQKVIDAVTGERARRRA